MTFAWWLEGCAGRATVVGARLAEWVMTCFAAMNSGEEGLGSGQGGRGRGCVVIYRHGHAQRCDSLAMVQSMNMCVGWRALSGQWHALRFRPATERLASWCFVIFKCHRSQIRVNLGEIPSYDLPSSLHSVTRCRTPRVSCQSTKLSLA